MNSKTSKLGAIVLTVILFGTAFFVPASSVNVEQTNINYGLLLLKVLLQTSLLLWDNTQNKLLEQRLMLQQQLVKANSIDWFLQKVSLF